jgi:hypothetical protein
LPTARYPRESLPKTRDDYPNMTWAAEDALAWSRACVEEETQDVQDSPVRYYVLRKKPRLELTASDIPRGLDPEDVASD